MLNRRLANDLADALRDSTMTWQDYSAAQRRMENRSFGRLLAFVKGEAYETTPEAQADEALIETFRAQHGISEGPAEDPRAALLARLDTLTARHRAQWKAGGAPPNPEEVRQALIRQIEWVLDPHAHPMPTSKQSIMSLMALWMSLGPDDGAGEGSGQSRHSVPTSEDGRQRDG